MLDKTCSALYAQCQTESKERKQSSIPTLPLIDVAPKSDKVGLDIVDFTTSYVGEKYPQDDSV